MLRDIISVRYSTISSYPFSLAQSKGTTLPPVLESGNITKVRDFSNIVDDRKRTLLHHAAYTGKRIDYLINGGADIEAKDDTGWRPLHFAAWSRNLQAVESLINNGADIEARDNNGKTPLHLVAENNHLEIVRLLIDKRANFEAKDKNGKTPLYYAILAASSEIALFLLENGASIETKDNYNMTLLHSAAKGGYLQAVKFLMDNGVNIEAKDNYNNTPLHYATREDHLDIVKYLIKEGADVNIKNSNGDTPMDIATKLGHLDIIKYFKSKSASRSRCSIEFKELPKEIEGSSYDYNTFVSDDLLDSNKMGYNRDQVISGTSNPSSLINDLFGWVKSSVGELLSSKPESSISQVDTQIDVNSTITLLSVLIRKVTGQRFISSVGQSISPLEAQGNTLNIIEEFWKIAGQAASKSGISIHRLEDYNVEMQKEVKGKIMSGKSDEISGILKSYVEKILPSRKIGDPGRLSQKKFDEFTVEFNKRLNVLNQSIQQILRNGDNKLEVSDAKQMSLEPQSYLNNTSVQGHLTRDKVKLIS